MQLPEVIEFIVGFRRHNPNATKVQVAVAAAQEFGLKRSGAVYACKDFAVRFSASNTTSFSGTVASLSRLRPFDAIPFLVVVIRPHRTEFLLANSTFLKKISHSSHILDADRVRGSFNGSDIVRSYEGVENSPENFEELFARHQEFTWEENLERLADATGQISGIGRRFTPTPAQREAILRSPALAVSLLQDPEYASLKSEIAAIVMERSPDILKYSRIDNVKKRGDSIEEVITGEISTHGLADMVRHLSSGVVVKLEIKTKLMDRASAPKAYNIDKALETLGRGDTVIAFCFVGLHVLAQRVTSSTVSIFDQTVLAATRIQFHWAGRNSRGVTQLTGDFSRVFDPDYQESIEPANAVAFLTKLLGA